MASYTTLDIIYIGNIVLLCDSFADTLFGVPSFVTIIRNQAGLCSGKIHGNCKQIRRSYTIEKAIIERQNCST